jgi:preprotein translocase subunit YajC
MKLISSTAALLIALSASLPAMAQTTAPAADGPITTPGTVASAATPPGGGYLNLLLLGGMIFFMWLFVIRPQSKRQKEHKTFLDSLQNGQEVITTSGLIGRVISVADAIVTIDLGSGPVRMLKSAIASRLEAQNPASIATPATAK